MRASRSALIALLSLSAALVAGCDGPTAPTTGALRVTASTTGADPDLDGYSVSVDGATPQAIGANGTLTISGLAAGSHVARIEGVATNCEVGNSNQRPVAVVAGETTTASFSVSCTLRTGALHVTTATAGVDADVDGYLVSIDGDAGQAIPANGTLTIGDVHEGPHTVTLLGVAVNCAVGAPHPRPANVSYGQTITAAFTVTCAPRTGSIRVTTAISGAGPELVVSVDGAPGQPVPASGEVTIGSLREGAHTVTLAVAATNCTIGAPNPRTVTVVFAQVSTTAFTVTCVARVGGIRVTTVTTGAEIDPDGYLATVWQYPYYGGPSQPVPVNGSVTFTALYEGEYTVVLEGMARNCTVGAPNPTTTQVVFGATTEVTFNIACVATGSIQLTTTTAGTDPDPNGYSVRVAGARLDTSASVGTVGSATISRLPPGDYEVTLRGVSVNCDVVGPNPRSVAVAGGAAVSMALEVACVSARQIAFVSGRDGNAEIYLIKSNGTAATRLTTNTAQDLEPAWSPDGNKIAFRSNRDGNAEIYVMNADGSGVLRLTDAAAADYQPTWSADGSKIAFVSERDGNPEIYAVSSGGAGGATRLTTNPAFDSDPAWSPEGSKIAFQRNRDPGSFGFDIYVMNADGSGVATQLTSLDSWEEAQPAWSPDGAKLAYAAGYCDIYYGCYSHIYIMNAAGGSGQTQVTLGGIHTDPAWSPDGRHIAFTSSDYYSGRRSVMSMRVNGGEVIEVTNGAASNPVWRP